MTKQIITIITLAVTLFTSIAVSAYNNDPYIDLSSKTPDLCMVEGFLAIKTHGNTYIYRDTQYHLLANGGNSNTWIKITNCNDSKNIKVVNSDYRESQEVYSVKNHQLLCRSKWEKVNNKWRCDNKEYFAGTIPAQQASIDFKNSDLKQDYDFDKNNKKPAISNPELANNCLTQDGKKVYDSVAGKKPSFVELYPTSEYYFKLPKQKFLVQGCDQNNNIIIVIKYTNGTRKQASIPARTTVFAKDQIMPKNIANSKVRLPQASVKKPTNQPVIANSNTKCKNGIASLKNCTGENNNAPGYDTPSNNFIDSVIRRSYNK
jgi:hypothetical protein